MGKRKYTLRARAEKQEETKSKIVDATIALHEELGPARTSVSAIAERAGVQRLTVYRYFPDEMSILTACTSRWLEQHPPPDPEAFADVADPRERTRRTLVAFAGWWRKNARMMHSAHRDEDLVPADAERMKILHGHLDGVRDRLVALWKPRGAKRNELRAILGHAVRFPTWETLAREGLDDDAIAELFCVWAEAVVGHRQRPGRSARGARRSPRAPHR